MSYIPKVAVHQVIGTPTAFDIIQGQEQITDSLNQVLDKEETHSTTIRDVSLLSASTVDVEHKLGRNWRGWYVVDKTADSRVWRDTTSTSSASSHLPLKCSANVTVTLVVF